MYQEEILKYYSDKKLLNAILEASLDREVVPILSSGSFGKRPNAVFYERDIEQLVKEGDTIWLPRLCGALEEPALPAH